jgi:hypothetical protein
MSKTGTPKEQLASLCTDMKWLKQQLSNHLSHHWVVTLTLLGVVVTEAVGFVVLVARHVFATHP